MSTDIVAPEEVITKEEDTEEQEQTELDDVCSLMTEELFVGSEGAVEAPKPFAAFGSYRQRHGDEENINVRKSSEAPAKLGGAEASPESGPRSTLPVSIPKSTNANGSSGMRRKVLRPRNWAREVEREEAWERKKDQYLHEELKQMEENQRARAVGRSVSDCGERHLPRLDSAGSGIKSRFRARSLTDEDLDELRGSIDLGFGFSNQADPELWNTLPALELCYAINKQYQNKGGSPGSTVEDDGTASEGSPMNSPSWTISSPGDPPQQVKTRLRHWAQAVACTIRQNYQQELY